MNTDRPAPLEPLLLARYVVPVLGCVAAVALGVFLVSYPNTITTTVLFLASLLVIMAFVRPAAGVYCLIGLSGYLDLVKRLGVLTGDVQALDVVVTLAIAPILFAGICAGLVFHFIIHRQTLAGWQRILLIVVTLLTGAVLVQAFGHGAGLLGGLQEFANSGAYVPLILLTGILFPGPVDVRRVLRFCLFVYVPVALYGIWQQVFGLSDFEISYLKSGFTINIGLLDDLRPRPFSTLNSPHALSVCTALLAGVAFLVPWDGPRGRLWRASLGTLYAVACACTVVRAGWVLLVFVALGYLCFRRRWTTALFYAALVAGFTLLITNAEPLLKSLDYLESRLPTEGDLGSQAFRLGTFSERLLSFRNVLTNPEFHTLFGNRKFQGSLGDDTDETAVVHDQIGQILIKYGFVGLGAVAALGGAGLFLAHRAVFRQRNGRVRATALALLSVLTATVYSGMLFGSHLSVFPVNIFFSLCAGALVVCSLPVSTGDGDDRPVVPGT